MNRSARWKLLLVFASILVAVWFLVPTYQIYFGMTHEEFDAKTVSEQDHLRASAIALGLDLQGGMDLLLEVDTSQIPKGDGAQSVDDLLDRALSVLRNRVDEFGVTEPVIQKTGERRITVQLPGLTDPNRARRIVQRVARLDFKLVREPDEIQRVLRRVDRLMAAAAQGLSAELDSVMADSLMADSLLASNPLLSRYIPLNESDIAFAIDDVPLMQEMMASAGVDSLLPTSDLVWGKDTFPLRDGRQARQLFVLEKKVQMSGEGIKRATISMDPSTGQPEVDLNFSTRAAALFARVTGANVGRRLAIVLDGNVASAPIIQGRISGGRASISGGGMSDREAADLKVVLEAGALPVPLNVIEERTVGPSLGRDSIRQGLKAGLVGAGAVVLFMLVYYRLSGVVAVIALSLNMLFLFAVLAKLGATLTLPGIAGVVLTIGFAVDANVLIFERMREEMAAERTIKASVERGFERALTAILDANLTTLIAAIVLLQFGSGPIRGFAVTLCIGIVANLFTAYFVSRLIFELITSRLKVSRISI